MRDVYIYIYDSDYIHIFTAVYIIIMYISCK